MFDLALGKKVLIALQLLVSNSNLESRGVGKENVECLQLLELHVEKNSRNLMKKFMFLKKPKRSYDKFHVLNICGLNVFHW
jgi:hypothetical protein